MPAPLLARRSNVLSCDLAANALLLPPEIDGDMDVGAAGKRARARKDAAVKLQKMHKFVVDEVARRIFQILELSSADPFKRSIYAGNECAVAL